MSQKIILVMLIGALVLSACATAFAGAAAPDPEVTEPVPAVEDPNQPVSSEDPEQGEPGPESWQPAPGDEDLIRNTAEIELAEIFILESYPPQFQLHLTGWKGNPCSYLRVKVNPPDEEKNIAVEVYTLTDPAALCIQVLESFDVTVPLGSLETGEYTILVNGDPVGSITSP